jgi:hypothetical protein
MGALYDNFEMELAVLKRRYCDSTTEELVALCLLALEREELVAIGYREDVLSPRLSSLRVTDEVREIIHHALVWTWKDEEMHAIYIRGAILKVAEWPLRMNAFCRQLAGAVCCAAVPDIRGTSHLLRIISGESSPGSETTSHQRTVSRFLFIQRRCGRNCVALLEKNGRTGRTNTGITAEHRRRFSTRTSR